MLITDTWRKSSRSALGNDCVEVRLVCGTIEVRDSKNPQAGIIFFTKPEWIAFIGGVKENEITQ